MGDRFYDDLQIVMSSHSIPSTDDYNVEDEETEGEYDGEEVSDVRIGEKSDELACPFCSEDFDVLGLCCHIDADHRVEVKPGICPVCATKVRINMASHVITQHESILKALCNKKHRCARVRSSIYLLRKELQEKHLRAVEDFPCIGSSSNEAADSMFLSFVNSPQPVYKPQATEAASPSEASLSGKSSHGDSDESRPVTDIELFSQRKWIKNRLPSSLSTDRHNEMTRRFEFIQGLILSTILEYS